MRVAFDENIPILMVELFQGLEGKGPAMGCEVVSAGDFRPAIEQGDENWIRRFAQNGGRILITGDARMRTLPHERAAIAETGLVAYFFGPPWNNTPFNEKCAVLLKQWPRIIAHALEAEPGSCWQVPCNYSDDDEFGDVSARPDALSLERQRKRKSMPKRPKKKKGKRKNRGKG